MELALNPATGLLHDASEYSFRKTRKTLPVCPHCKGLVFWVEGFDRVGHDRVKGNKRIQVKRSSVKPHFRHFQGEEGADETCREAISQTYTPEYRATCERKVTGQILRVFRGHLWQMINSSGAILTGTGYDASRPYLDQLAEMADKLWAETVKYLPAGMTLDMNKPIDAIVRLYERIDMKHLQDAETTSGHIQTVLDAVEQDWRVVTPAVAAWRANLDVNTQGRLVSLVLDHLRTAQARGILRTMLAATIGEKLNSVVAANLPQEADANLPNAAVVDTAQELLAEMVALTNKPEEYFMVELGAKLLRYVCFVDWETQYRLHAERTN